MRPIRFPALALAVCAALAAPRALAAQQAIAPWQDSWYWGAYGGQTSFATSVARVYSAPTVGVDWVLTRTRFALNVFAEQSYFTDKVSSVEAIYPAGAPFRVKMSDMRRIGFSGMVFTPEIWRFKPYVGLGYAFNFVKDAAPIGVPQSNPNSSAAQQLAQRDSLYARIDDARARGKVFGEFGVMLMYRGFAPFVVYSLMPTQGSKDWLLNGAGNTEVWKAGLRYNFGTSIDKKPW